MFTKTHATLALVGLALPLALSSCSKQDVVTPTPAAPTASAAAGMSVQNGRVVFADVESFKNTLATYAKMSASDLAAWEKGAQFSSLRAAAASEATHLEQLETAGQSTAAYQLMSSFGFPTYYAALLNTAGEYQIGKQIFWFHDGFKYEAASETELQQIKQNPSVATAKTQAGLQAVTVGPNGRGLSGGSQANAKTVLSNQVESDGKYVSSTFGLDGDQNSKRRVIFGARVFSEYINTVGGVGNWHSILYLRFTVDYYSSGKGRWYSADGTYRSNSYDVSFSGTAAREGYESYGTSYQNSYSTNGYAGPYTNNQDYSLADVMVQAPRNYDSNGNIYSSDPRYIYWNFTITGSLYSRVGQSQPYYYGVGYGGYELW